MSSIMFASVVFPTIVAVFCLIIFMAVFSPSLQDIRKSFRIFSNRQCSKSFKDPVVRVLALFILEMYSLALLLHAISLTFAVVSGGAN